MMATKLARKVSPANNVLEKFVIILYIYISYLYTFAAVSESLSNPNKLFHVMDRVDVAAFKVSESASTTSTMTM